MLAWVSSPAAEAVITKYFSPVSSAGLRQSNEASRPAVEQHPSKANQRNKTNQSKTERNKANQTNSQAKTPRHPTPQPQTSDFCPTYQRKQCKPPENPNSDPFKISKTAWPLLPKRKQMPRNEDVLHHLVPSALGGRAKRFLQQTGWGRVAGRMWNVHNYYSICFLWRPRSNWLLQHIHAYPINICWICWIRRCSVTDLHVATH